ncbi:MAG: c-type cytochrome [Candidatus Sulfotelmatobacter sp.]
MGLTSAALFGQVAAKDHKTTTRDGVYTPAQAASGKGIYTKSCTVCHLENLAGGANQAPALKGKQFLSDWKGKPLRSLFGRIISTMPSEDPGSLSEQETLDVLAYLLQENSYAAGKRSLGPPDALNKIQFVAAK